MATRSRIGVVQDDGTVRSIYCHWDGYPKYNGKVLLNHYDLEKTERLVSLGDISSLDVRTEPFGDHTFDNPEKGVVVAYGRDRGEKDVDAIVFNTWDDAHTEEFCYIMDRDGTWYVSGWGNGIDGNGFVPLTEELIDNHNS